ncbi:467_t:CDS:10 [Funneliformis caledonium]|uniref:467_t:CDS:1 n=1 Tax=Funneliformis caledonium TaxID=1117310 RepID=A0A9N8VZQ8_9GLOM|nr:467_t:CDS:10 [Funneliformis caledonium]
MEDQIVRDNIWRLKSIIKNDHNAIESESFLRKEYPNENIDNIINKYEDSINPNYGGGLFHHLFHSLPRLYTEYTKIGYRRSNRFGCIETYPLYEDNKFNTFKNIYVILKYLDNLNFTEAFLQEWVDDIRQRRNTEIFEQFMKCVSAQPSMASPYETDPQAIYTSRLLDFKNLPEPQNSIEINNEFYDSLEMCDNVSIEMPPPHNGEPISMMEISPNGKYLVTYSEVDKTIVVWNVENIKDIIEGEDLKGKHLINYYKHELVETSRSIFHICVSDEKILAYINNNYEIKIVDLNDKQPQEIKLYFEFDAMEIQICNFNKDGRLILFCSVRTNVIYDFINIVCVYSISTLTKKTKCQNIYKLPKDAEIKTKDIRISNNENYTCMKINDEKIFIHSNKHEFSTMSLDLKNEEKLKHYMKHHRNLLFPLFDHPLIWKPNNKCYAIDSQSKNYRFLNVDDNELNLDSLVVLKVKNDDKDHLEFSYFSYQQDILGEYQLDIGSILWKIKKDELGIQTFIIEENLNKLMEEDAKKFIEMLLEIKTNVNFLGSRIDKYKIPIKEFIKMKSMTKLDIKISQALEKNFIERLTIIDEEKDHDKWKNKIGELMKDFNKRINKIIELKKDPNQFKIIITKTFLKVNEDLIRLFGTDKYLDRNGLEILVYKILKNNEIALLTNIGIFIFHLNNEEKLISLDYFYLMEPEPIIKIISKINGYPEVDDKDRYYVFVSGLVSYIQKNNEEFSKYGSAFLIYAIKLKDSNLIDDIYNRCLHHLKQDLDNNIDILNVINASMPLLDKYYPEYIARYSLDTNMIIDSIEYKIDHLSTSHLYPFSNIEIVDLTPSIVWTKYTIKVDDIWWELIAPRPSSFVETINREIYKTWNGEELINFKWNAYGKYYYYAIWMKFTALLGCFMAASTFSDVIVSEDIRKRLLTSSIVLGFTHFTFEIRQFIYDPIKWIIDPWNYLDLGAFLVPTITSIYWLEHSKYLVSIFFAHAFLILLQPRKDYSLDNPPPLSNNGPNNPWKLTDSYNQVLENGTIAPNSSFVQQPDMNTNMFTDYGTSVLSMYLYLIGDSNALSNWEYKNNSQLTILMVLFSLLIAVYLMNLLIGLLSNAIEEDNNRVSYFVQMAKILAEIELFYLFPNQRRWKSWFPDVIYYHADADETRRKIKELIKDGEWNSDKFSEMKQKLLNKLRIQDK